MISFKYEEQLTHSDLMSIASKRLDRGHQAVVANRGEDKGPSGEQIAYLVTKDSPELKMIGKLNIASKLCDYLETL